MTNEEKRKQWRENRLRELSELPIDESYEELEGMFIPFGSDVLLKQIEQGQIKTKSGIIAATAASKTIGASIGCVYAVGEMVQKPIYEGMRVYYEPGTQLRVYIDGEEFIQVNEHLVYGAATPKTYLTPYVADSHAKRREERRSGMIAADKRDQEVLDKKFDQHEQEVKKRDKIQ
jgi:co-chaperonin GroES (HSP10)